MYSMDIRKNFNLGVFSLLSIDENYYDNKDESYQILLTYLIWILMALVMIFIIILYWWKILRIKKKRAYNLLFLHNFTLMTIICGLVYLLAVYLLIMIIEYLIFNRTYESSISFNIFCILVIWVLLIMPTKIIIEIIFDLVRFYIKKLFGFDQETNYLEWHFVGLKNEPKALLYHMLNWWRKFIYLIPIYMIYLPIFIFKGYKINMMYVLAMIIISSIELSWLVYICKVYPYDNLSHNRIIIFNQISVVFILTLGVFTVKIKSYKLNLLQVKSFN